MTLDQFFKEVNSCTGQVPDDAPVKFFDGTQSWDIRELVIARHRTGDSVWIETVDGHHEYARRRIADLERALKPFGDWAISLKTPAVWQVRRAAEAIALRRLNWPDLDPIPSEESAEFSALSAHPEASALSSQQEAINQELLEALKLVLKSAIPHPVEHPTMFQAWQYAKTVVAKAEGRNA